MLGVDLSRREVLLCATISCLFLCACGYVPPLGRSWDWIKHFAIINELADHPWPPVNDEPHTFLRYYLGYYLVPPCFLAHLAASLLMHLYSLRPGLACS